jgi:methylmalonyl-CoA/ethylmalonyl-CoA epimerase
MAEQGPPSKMSRPLRLHHVGVLVKDLHLASEQYVSNLGYELRSEIIHDPIQTAYVRFLLLPGDLTYLELISPAGRGSLLENALKKNAGIHHLCYSTPNIEETIEELRQAGCVCLSMPHPAVAFNQRRIAWTMNRDHLLIELVEQGPPGEL